MNIGKNIKEHRISLGITQDELAKKLCVSSQAVSKWETGRSCPDVSLILPISRALGISTDVLFGKAESDLNTEPDSVGGFSDCECAFAGTFSHQDEKLDMFRYLSNEQTMNAIRFLFSKKTRYAFEKATIRKNLSCSETEADRVIEDMIALRIVTKDDVDINGESKTIYRYLPMPTLLATLIIAEKGPRVLWTSECDVVNGS